MVKLGKRKLAELSEISKKKSAALSDSDDIPERRGASSSSDEETNVNKKTNNKQEVVSKKKRASNASAKITNIDSDSDESDDQPLNGGKVSSASASPRKKQQQQTPKAKAKSPRQPPPPPTIEKKQNKKSKPEDEADTNDKDDVENNPEEFEVAAIVGHKLKNGESFFLVRWKGYGKEDDTWEPEADLNCDDLIEAFNKKSANKKTSGKKSPGAAKRGRKVEKVAESSDPDKEWAVERILDFVEDDEQGCLYRIRWKGFGAKEDTWEPESNLSCKGLIEKFKRNQFQQSNVDAKQLRESPKKTKRLVNETTPRSNLHNRIERSSKRSAAKNRVFYGEE